MPPFRFPTRTAAFDRMIVAAAAVAADVLTAPYGGARLPEAEPSDVGTLPTPTPAEAYSIGYHAVASARPIVRPQ